MSSYDSMDVCRLCLAKDQHTHQIFADVGEDDVSIDTKIHTWLPIKVLREDKFPHVICTSCHYIVNSAYTLWKTCLNADKQLREWQSNVNTHRYTTVTTMLDQDIMKGEQSNENRLDGSVMQQVSGHQNSMNMDMDNMQMMSIMMPNNNQQQITSVPIDTSGGSIQNIQVIAGSSTQATHDQIIQSQTNVSTQQEEEEDESTDDSEDECDGDEGLPIKEESEEDPNNSRTIEPTTFVNVSLHCDEAGPSGIRQQKISDIQELAQAADIDPKTGAIQFRVLTVRANTDIGDDEEKYTIQDSAQSAIDSNAVDPLAMEDPLSEKKKRGITSKKSSNALRRTTRSCKRTDSTLANAWIQDSAQSAVYFNAVDPLAVKDPLSEGSEQETTSEKSSNASQRTTRSCKRTNSTSANVEKRLYKSKQQERKKYIKYECPTCQMFFVQPDAFEQHMKKHRKRRPYKCTVCEKTLRCASKMIMHMQSHNGVEYMCKTCGYTTTSKDCMRSHNQRHEQKFRFRCEQCGKRFMSNYALEDHRTCHLDAKTFVCEYCNKAYSQNSHLITHKRTIHGIRRSARQHQCHLCSRSFTSERGLRNHVSLHTRSFQCAHCGIKFAKKRSLAVHVHKHIGEQSYQCKLCTKTFASWTVLTEHLLIHTGEKPYTCDLCDDSFAKRKSLMAHRRKHPGDHPPPPRFILRQLKKFADNSVDRIVHDGRT